MSRFEAVRGIFMRHIRFGRKLLSAVVPDIVEQNLDSGHKALKEWPAW